jgi:hypothetical protein
MVNRTELEAEIVAAQRELQAAKQAEQQRIDFETAQQRRIAAAQAQIANLEHQQWLEGIKEQSRPYHEAIAYINASVRDIIKALEVADLTAAEPKIKPMFEAFDVAVKTAKAVNEAIVAKQSPLWQATYAENGGKLVGYGDASDGDHVTLAQAKQAANRAVAHLDTYMLPAPDTLPIERALKHPLTGLYEWVSSIPDGYERQRRRGLCYALVGWFCDPGMDSIFNGRMMTRYQP